MREWEIYCYSYYRYSKRIRYIRTFFASNKYWAPNTKARARFAKKTLFKIAQTNYEPKEVKHVNKIQFGHDFRETHCFRGYPIYGSCKQFLETDSTYVLHLDSDMIFYEAPEFSWIQEGVRIMEENPRCPLRTSQRWTAHTLMDGSLNQGTTHYQIDTKEVFTCLRTSPMDIILFTGKDY